LKARDVMVSPVITADVSATVQDVARLLLQHRISAVPVLDGGKLVGIVSEGDLLHRAEAGTQRKRSWWLDLVASDAALATDYVQANSRRIADVMSQNLVTATPETPLAEIASLLEKHAIKRVPIVSAGKLVGIVSRANLLQAVASRPGQLKIEQTDEELRKLITARLEAQPWAHTYRLNVTVTDGVAEIWGMTRSDAERRAIRVAAENTPGVRSVKDNLVELPVGGDM
jgi:CBS-domain-containing membrane protein